MLKVLLVSGSLPPMRCGVGDYTHALAHSLAADPALEVGVLTSTDAGPISCERLHLFPIVRRWDRSDLRDVMLLVRNWRPDVVHFQFPTQGYRGDLAWQLPLRMRSEGIPVVQTWHEHVAARWGGWRSAVTPTLIEKVRTAIPQVSLSLAGGPIVAVRPGFAERMPRWYRLLGIQGRLRFVPVASAIPRVVLSEPERSEVRRRYGAGQKALLAFFGFLYEHKGIEDLLCVLEPSRHHLVMVGEAKESDPYQRDLIRRLRAPPFAKCVTLAGFLPADEAARVMAAADAVVLPFKDGAGEWNTTLKAASLQGTFVLTTGVERNGYDKERNVYYARPGDVSELRRALDAHCGRRGAATGDGGPTWQEIAQRHVALYREVASR